MGRPCEASCCPAARECPERIPTRKVTPSRHSYAPDITPLRDKPGDNPRHPRRSASRWRMPARNPRGARVYDVPGVEQNAVRFGAGGQSPTGNDRPMDTHRGMPGVHRWFALLALALVTSACSTGVPVPLRTPLTQPPLTDQARVAVAVRYRDDLRNHGCTVSKGYIAASWTIKIGPASIEMFDQVFAALFEKVIALDANHGAGVDTGQFPLIELHLIDYDGCEAAWPITGSRIGVTYEATLRAPDGRLIGRWQGRGRAEGGEDLSAFREGFPRIDVETWYLGAATRLAMRRAAADFIFNFHDDPSIQAWLRR